MTLQRSRCVRDDARAVPAQPGAPARERLGAPAPVVRDLRERARAQPAQPALRRRGRGGRLRAARQRQVHADPARGRAAGGHRLPGHPGPLGRAGCRGCCRTPSTGRWSGSPTTRGCGGRCAPATSVVVHDCGTQAWVRRWLAREARRRGRGLHLVLLDVTPAGGPGRASASAAAGSPATPSPGTGGRSAGCCATRRRAACPRAAPRRCCWTGTAAGALTPDRASRSVEPRQRPGRLARPGPGAPASGRRARGVRCPCAPRAGHAGREGSSMDMPEQADPHPQDGGWPGNELEEVLAASLGSPAAGRPARRGARPQPRLGAAAQRRRPRQPRPRPAHGGDRRRGVRPRLQLRAAVPAAASAPICPSPSRPPVEFARGLPPQLGIAVNPGGAVGVPLPPPAVAELCRAGRTPLDGPASGGRVRLFEPDWQEDPVDFLAAAAGEFEASGVVRTARRALASVEGGAAGALRRRPALRLGGRRSATPRWTRSAGRSAGSRCPGRSTSSCWTSRRTRSPTGCWSRCGPSTSATEHVTHASAVAARPTSAADAA